MSSDIFENYYLQQVQTGRGERDQDETDLGIYRASPSYYNQKGSGFLDFLGNAFRFLKPLFVTNAKKVGEELLRTSGNILSDIADK